LLIGRNIADMDMYRSRDRGNGVATSIKNGSSYEYVYEDSLIDIPAFHGTRGTYNKYGKIVASSSQYQSEVRVAKAEADGSPTRSEPPLDNDNDDNGDNNDRMEIPSLSLILSAPVYRVVDDKLEVVYKAVEKAVDRPIPEARRRSFPSISVIQTVINLFAGRRDISKTRHPEKQRKICPEIPKTATASNHHENRTLPQADSCRVFAHSPFSSPPKLTVRQAIPPIQQLSTSDLFNQPGYSRDMAPASEHEATGYAVTAEDVLAPVKTQRGFHVPDPGLSPGPSLRHRSDHFAGNLLDRDGDVWARWHKRYSNSESNPFSRARPTEI
jgi:hypothetical protein